MMQPINLKLIVKFVDFLRVLSKKETKKLCIINLIKRENIVYPAGCNSDTLNDKNTYGRIVFTSKTCVSDLL